MAAPEPPPEGSRPLSALLGAIAQAAFQGSAGVPEELLRAQLYPEAPPEEFRALRAKMGGLLQHCLRRVKNVTFTGTGTYCISAMKMGMGTIPKHSCSFSSEDVLCVGEPLVEVCRMRDVTAGTRLRLRLLWWLPVFISLSSSFVIKCIFTPQKNDTFCK